MPGRDPQEWLNEVVADLTRQAAQAHRVRELHFRREWDWSKDSPHFHQTEFPDMCDHCQRPYPCETIEVMEGK